MRKKATPPILLFSLSDERVNKIVDDYIDFVTNPYHEWRQTDEWFDSGFVADPSGKPNIIWIEPPREKQPLRQRDEYDTRREIYTLPKPHRDVAEFKFRALIDTIYRRGSSSKYGKFRLNKKVLDLTYGDEYLYMLETLERHEVVKEDVLNEMSVPHSEWFHCSKYQYAASVLPYKKQTERVLSRFMQKWRKKQENDAFVKQYESNVGLINIIDWDGLNNYMNDSSNFESEHAKRYWESIIDRLTLNNGYDLSDKQKVSFGINESDNQIGRFYHLGTSMPKEMKKFTNLQFGIDIHNSHPLLFNYLIFNYYFNNTLIDISSSFTSFLNNDLFFLITDYILNYSLIQALHNVPYNLCKYLKNNNIIKTSKRIILPEDVIQYIYDTSTGQLWDKIQSAFPAYSRDEIKVSLFSSVFYSQSTRTGYYDRDSYQYVELDRKVWVDMFKKQYPSVLSLINKTKKDLHVQCEKQGLINEDGKDKIQLPHLLMRFESVLFTRALKDAFKAHIPAIGIHDCIAVIGDTIDLNQQQQLKDILLNRYKECGLIPSLSVEVYH